MNKKDLGINELKLVDNLKPPVARSIPDTTEIHGIRIYDNYSWLKDMDNTNQTALQCIHAENEYTDRMLEHTKKLQDRLYKEFVNRIDGQDVEVPVKIDSFFYYSREEKGKDYRIFCRKKSGIDAPEEIILDVNKLAGTHKFFDVGEMDVSPDHNVLAYAVDTVGNEEYFCRFKNLKNSRILDDIIFPFDTGAWANDNKSFFYAAMDENREHYKYLYRHELGTEQKKDVMIFHETDDAFGVGVYRTRSRKYLIMESGDEITNEIRYLNADNPSGDFKLIREREKGVEYYLEHNGNNFYFLTNENGAVDFKIMMTMVDAPEKDNWKQYICHKDSVYITGFDVFREYMVIQEYKNALPQLHVIDFNGGRDYCINFPELAYSIYPATNPEFDTKEYRFYYSSLVTPNSVFDYNLKQRNLCLRKKEKVLGGYDQEKYSSERIFVKARDGMRIPLTLVFKNQMFKKNGTNPLFLYAYGAYGERSEPDFSSVRLSLLDRGFVYAIAHVRGGSELGRMWYDRGKLLNKMNTFTDFIDCAEYLIRENYSCKEKMVINGASAGGLLMGAVANMRPELFKIIIAEVPAVDELNNVLDTSIPGAEFHFDEWGNPFIKEQFESIRTWDPYQNVNAQDYPHMFVTAGVNDSRVPYWAPAKWVAKLRALKTDNNVLLLKTYTTGHSGASGRYDYLSEIATEYAFIFDILDIK